MSSLKLVLDLRGLKKMKCQFHCSWLPLVSPRLLVRFYPIFQECISTFLNFNGKNIFTLAHTKTHTRTYIHAYTHTHTHTRTYTHTGTPTKKHTYTHANATHKHNNLENQCHVFLCAIMNVNDAWQDSKLTHPFSLKV